MPKTSSQVPKYGNFANIVSSTVETLSGKFFPNVSFDQLCESSYGNEVVSSLPLQIVLFFSALFFPFWLISSLTMFSVKQVLEPNILRKSGGALYLFHCISGLHQFVLIAIYIAIPLIEVIRVYIGNIGNLEEKVPELAGSWLLTLLLQLPLLIFLLVVPGTMSLPMDYAVNSVYLLFILLHLAFGYKAVNGISSHQAKLYHMFMIMRNNHND
ncbi:transmembrane protein 17B-like isoform X1 [Macrobrachium nipponense]|uniref:transmembrane protein 17B-like isoform X1 n=1 Tax=Macrobrachium nipponense TaxID=159736 RepID=UPI0030C7B26D